MLIVVARVKSNSDAGGSADGDDESGYLLPSVTGAMYLLVASTAHDLRAGYSLLVDGRRVGHRAFGTGLLVVYGIMVSAAMTVLVSTSEDSASVVLNAVTVLVVADLVSAAPHMHFVRVYNIIFPSNEYKITHVPNMYYILSSVQRRWYYLVHPQKAALRFPSFIDMNYDSFTISCKICSSSMTHD